VSCEGMCVPVYGESPKCCTARSREQ
jgi:hypothetical protein